jgi:hypothetical protein
LQATQTRLVPSSGFTIQSLVQVGKRAAMPSPQEAVKCSLTSPGPRPAAPRPS